MVGWEFVEEHARLLVLLLTVVLSGVGLWFYTYFSCGWCLSSKRMDGKTVIITGSNTGIGKQTALNLARRGARVILACRNLDKANLARESIVEATQNKNVVVKLLDVSLMSSVRKFAEDINKTEARLDVLIHNAGVSIDPHATTDEGLSVNWATNHFGPFLLTHLLIDLLKKTGKSRIVMLSSLLHHLGSVDVKNPNPLDESFKGKIYCSTKFANVLFCNELARRIQNTGVTANSLHPGAIYTQIFDYNHKWTHLLLMLLTPFFKSVEEGAQTSVYLSVSDDVEGVSGKYFSDCQERCPSKRTLDLGLAKKFWEVSEVIVGLKPSEPHI